MTMGARALEEKPGGFQQAQKTVCCWFVRCLEPVVSGLLFERLSLFAVADEPV